MKRLVIFAGSLLLLLLSIVGCAKDDSDKLISFTHKDVKYVDVFTGGSINYASVKAVTEAEDIKRIISVLNAYTIEREATDDEHSLTDLYVSAGGVGLRFNFYLSNGTKFLIHYKYSYDDENNYIKTADGVYVVNGDRIDESQNSFWLTLKYPTEMTAVNYGEYGFPLFDYETGGR